MLPLKCTEKMSFDACTSREHISAGRAAQRGERRRDARRDKQEREEVGWGRAPMALCSAGSAGLRWPRPGRVPAGPSPVPQDACLYSVAYLGLPNDGAAARSLEPFTRLGPCTALAPPSGHLPNHMWDLPFAAKFKLNVRRFVIVWAHNECR